MELERMDLLSYKCINEFKSIRRAMRRGHVTSYGIVMPKRPFNNRSRKRGTRPHEVEKERIYEQLKFGK